MKIAISTTKNSLEAAVDPKFGRASGFMLHDTESNTTEYLNNQINVDASQGAGIQAAQTLVNKDVETVISGHCGPKAFKVLNGAGIKIFLSEASSVAEAIQKLSANQLEQQLS